MTKLNQKGFGAIEAILIVVIIVILAFIGWFVWSRHNHSATKVANSTPTANSANTPPPATTSGSYLSVPAWSVKLPSVSVGPYTLVIPSKVNGGTDNPSAPYMDSPNGSLQDLWLEASGLTSTDTKCSPDTTGYQSVGSIFRDTSLNDNSQVAALPHVHVGGYYYFLQVGYGDNCIARPTPQQQSFINAITASFNKLESAS